MTDNPLTVGIMWRIDKMKYKEMLAMRRSQTSNLEYLTGETLDYFNQSFNEKKREYLSKKQN